MSPTLQLTLLGGFCLVCGEARLAGPSWRSRKGAQLVKLLALAPEHSLHREQVAETLWPDHPPAAAANNLRHTLHVTRRQLQALGPAPAELLRAHGERIHLASPTGLEIDVVAFEVAAREAQRSGDPARYWRAIERYSGPLLPGDLYEDWAIARREQLAGTYLSLLDEAARLHQARGEETGALAALRRIIEAEPADEDAHVRLMRLYARTGRRSLALRQYAQLAQALAHELDTVPEPATRALFEAIKEGRYPEMSSPGPALPAADAATNLPHTLSSFVGRERDLAAVNLLIAHHRLVTLVGPGGSGKTRLAVEVGWRQLSERKLPVRQVELAALGEPALLTATIAEALGIRSEGGPDALARLIAQLREQTLLLILDNCEHLLAACAVVADALLAGCPGVRLLATSRQPLRVPGERPWLVPTLPLPPSGARLAELTANDAIRLFMDRVHAQRADLSLTADNAAAVTAICRRLEGLPLALELAAARATVLSLPQLAARLDDVLGVLSTGRRGPDRQRTLRATLDWSYDLLEPAEQRFFQRLSVFRGGWDLPAAEEIARGAPGETASSVLDLLSGLVEQSLVQVDLSQAEARYRLLEPVRQYAAERLSAADEPAAIAARHAAHYLRLAETAESGLSGPDQASWLTALDREQDNRRAALDGALTRGDAETVLRFCGALWPYWALRWRSAEGIGWISSGLAIPGSGALTALRARAALGAGELARRILDFPQAATFLRLALQYYRELEDREGTANALIYLANALGMAGDQAEARRYAEESLELFRSLGDRQGTARALNTLGEDARLSGDYARAERFYQEALALDQALGDRNGQAIRLHNLGYVALHHGDLAAAAASFQRSHEIHAALGYRSGPLSFLEGMAACASAAGRPELAARLYGAWEAQCALPNVEFKLHPPDQVEYDRAVARVRHALGRDAQTAARAAGANLSLGAAVAQALTLAQDITRDVVARVSAGAALLTPREYAVAGLVAHGLTNPQIAAQLGVAERTIDTHVGRILRKLGVHSRLEIAARLDRSDANPA